MQVLLLSRNVEPLGQRRYWPIYEAAEEAGLPVGVHAFGFGGNPITAVGLAELLHRGDGRTFAVPADRAGKPRAGRRVRALSETEHGDDRGRFRLGAVAGVAARQDFARLHSEVPHLKRKPSEYIRDHIWWTTQPMEDPERREHLFELIEWIGWDKLLFATDYPHWDYDEPSRVLPAGVSDANSRRSISTMRRRFTGSATKDDVM